MKPRLLLLFIIIPLTNKAQQILPIHKIDFSDDKWIGEGEPYKNLEGEMGMSCALTKEKETTYMVNFKFDINDLPDYDSITLTFRAGFSTHDSKKTSYEHFYVDICAVEDTNWQETQLTCIFPALLDEFRDVEFYNVILPREIEAFY